MTSDDRHLTFTHGRYGRWWETETYRTHADRGRKMGAKLAAIRVARAAPRHVDGEQDAPSNQGRQSPAANSQVCETASRKSHVAPRHDDSGNVKNVAGQIAQLRAVITEQMS